MQSHHEPCVDDFRILGRQVVLLNRPDAIKHTLVTHNDRYERKAPGMRRVLEPLLGDGLFISDGELWKQRRSLVADIVHKNRLGEFAPIMETVLQETVERQAQEPDGSLIDGVSYMAKLTAEIISRTVFGTKLGNEAADEIVSGFSQYQRAANSFNLGYFLGADEGWAIRRSRRLNSAIARVHRPIERIVEQHIDGDTSTVSMVALLMRRREKNPELDIDVTAIRNEAATIFMAGHETVAVTLSWAFYCLSKARWADEALHQELSTVLGNRQPVYADLPKLPFCRAVIEETLRLYPPVPIYARQPDVDDTIMGVKVEKAGLILVVPWLLHRTAAFWPDPHAFKPDRFVDKARPQPFTYIPFAVGPRVCAGLAFGMAEAVLSLATLAQRFRFEVPDDYVADPRCRMTLRPHDGMPLRVKHR
ncbi:MAG: cytochrome P450 [Pseudomonadota bacterium]